MVKFKIGDKVRRINSCNEGVNEGDIGFITSLYTSSGDDYCTLNIGNHGVNCGHSLKNIELIETNNKITNMKEKFIQMFLKEPQKSFRKAGITNGDGLITEDGATLLLSWLLDKNADTFKIEVVDGLLAEETK